MRSACNNRECVAAGIAYCTSVVMCSHTMYETNLKSVLTIKFHFPMENKR